MKIQQTREVKDPRVEILVHLDSGKMRITFEEDCQDCGGHGCGRHGSGKGRITCNQGNITSHCKTLKELEKMIGRDESTNFLKDLRDKIIDCVGPPSGPGPERGGPGDW